MPGREERDLEVDGRRVRACVAWRAPGGEALLYFRPLEPGEGAPDRRSALAAGERLAELDGERLRERYRSGAALTPTEARLRAPDGREWLVQSVGPVWAGTAAPGPGELLFTSLEGEPERFGVADGDAGRSGPAALEAAWRRGKRAVAS